mgnify:CR=1 FL=1
MSNLRWSSKFNRLIWRKKKQNISIRSLRRKRKHTSNTNVRGETMLLLPKR